VAGDGGAGATSGTGGGGGAGGNKDGGASDAVTDAGDAATDAGLPSKCPASYAAVLVGTSCLDLVTCDYDEGRCGCLLCQVTPELFLDVWSCRGWNAAGPGCPPKSRPVGSSCNTSGQTCNYDALCSISVGDNLVCQGGKWQKQPSPLGTCAVQMCR
jgi:hypothetical protein